MKQRTGVSVIVVLVAIATAHAEIIDRILAVVESQVITLSDARAVLRLGLESVPPGGDPIAQALDKLIDRQLMLVEVNRYAPPEPAPGNIDARLREIRGRFADALAFAVAIQQIGIGEDDVRRYVRDTLRIEAYLQQRFTATIQPSDDEIAAYYRLNESAFVRNGALVPYAQARTEARARLVDERRATLVRDWLAGLRRRANVNQLYYSGTATRT